MTAIININIPSLAVHAVYLAILFTAVMMTWQIRGIERDRSWTLDVRHRSAQQTDAPWYATGEADRIERPSPDITLYRVNPYHRDDEEDLALAA